MIEIRDAKKYFKLGGEVVRALDGIDLKINDGEFVSVVGPSGSGKTTLMHNIGGIDQLSSGSIKVDGVELSDMNDKELSRYRNETVGFVFQTFNLQPTLSALENVELPLMFSGEDRHSMRKKAKEALDKVGLGRRLNHKPGELSGGQRQRVSIARAITNKPSIILADEPTGNLDSVTGKKIIKLLESLNKKEKITLLIVTHDDRIASKSDRVIHILDGKIRRDLNNNKKSKFVD